MKTAEEMVKSLREYKESPGKRVFSDETIKRLLKQSINAHMQYLDSDNSDQVISTAEQISDELDEYAKLEAKLERESNTAIPAM